LLKSENIYANVSNLSVMISPRPINARQYATTPLASPQWFEHTVQKGETLSTISSQYSISIEEIARANELKDLFFLGYYLTITLKEALK
ncbi:LysM peptidoglycan-binding domain-containing protein, partial [Acetomicrobium sp. S15 = DSM 107314]|uniref:LysM peptidoglycan-binding domain-containing protein n=1 Tax=Acetomicrobium sp. S15 = DSM 107314 TaxID=2529858 RepID=UPI0018E15957